MAGQSLDVIKKQQLPKGDLNIASSTTTKKASHITGMNISFSNLFWGKFCFTSHGSPKLFPPLMQPTVKTKAATEDKAFCDCISKSLFFFHEDFSLNLTASE